MQNFLYAALIVKPMEDHKNVYVRNFVRPEPGCSLSTMHQKSWLIDSMSAILLVFVQQRFYMILSYIKVSY